MRRVMINPRHTFALEDTVERDNGTNTYDFLLTDDLDQEVAGIDYEPANVGGWIMLDVSSN